MAIWAFGSWMPLLLPCHWGYLDFSWRNTHVFHYKKLISNSHILLNYVIDHFRIHTLLQGLGGIKQKNVLFITEPQDDFFCFIPSSLAAKYEF